MIRRHFTFVATTGSFKLQRLGQIMEPEADYESQTDGSGGCEDPRVTFVGSITPGRSC